MKIDEIYTYQPTGQQVRVVALDSDPSCDVLTVLVEDPDEVIMAQRSELVK